MSITSLPFSPCPFSSASPVSVGALALEEAELRRVSHVGDLLRLAAAAVLENFGYRQLNSWWRFRGLWEWMRGVKSWGEMTRKGFSAGAAEPMRTDILLESPAKQAA